jgi:Na+-driven multidrug efflux pump
MMWFWGQGMFAPWMWLFGLFWLISLVFIIWALIDIARADKDTGYKIIWAAIAIFLGLIGVFLYYLLEKGSHSKESQKRRKR